MPIEDKNGCYHSEENGRFVSKQGINEKSIRKSKQALNYQKAIYIYSNDSQLSQVSHNSTQDNFYNDFPTVKLSREEYAMVMHELATNLTKEEHSVPIAIKHIRNYTYRVHIISFGHYRVIGKWIIRAKKRKR